VVKQVQKFANQAKLIWDLPTQTPESINEEAIKIATDSFVRFIGVNIAA